MYIRPWPDGISVVLPFKKTNLENVNQKNVIGTAEQNPYNYFKLQKGREHKCYDRQDTAKGEYL